MQRERACAGKSLQWESWLKRVSQSVVSKARWWQQSGPSGAFFHSLPPRLHVRPVAGLKDKAGSKGHLGVVGGKKVLAVPLLHVMRFFLFFPPPASPEQGGQPEAQELRVTHPPSTPSLPPREEMGLFGTKSKLRHAQRSLETAVPT